MSEEYLQDQQDNLPEQEAADLPAEQGADAPAEADKKPHSIKELIAYIKAHENLRQVVLFTLFSMICGATQMLITLLLPIILKAISPDKMNAPFGFIKMGSAYFFDFTDKGSGLGTFLGWLIGSIWGQALTFILNRKKTFNVPDHVAFRAIAYAVMAVLIIVAQTAIGKLEGVLKSNDPNASDFVNVIYNLIAQVVAGIAAFTMSFLGNKFFVMRKWKVKGQEAQPATQETAETEDAE